MKIYFVKDFLSSFSSERPCAFSKTYPTTVLPSNRFGVRTLPSPYPPTLKRPISVLRGLRNDSKRGAGPSPDRLDGGRFSQMLANGRKGFRLSSRANPKINSVKGKAGDKNRKTAKPEGLAALCRSKVLTASWLRASSRGADRTSCR
jgi:hypothetical protein